jgi:hypothetical protein
MIGPVLKMIPNARPSATPISTRAYSGKWGKPLRRACLSGAGGLSSIVARAS